ncbi:MAG: ribosome-binding factor A [Candidatus Methanofastidiosum sp.]|nr:ribosome-binding factor A [Methanofastidiosum sp.]
MDKKIKTQYSRAEEVGKLIAQYIKDNDYHDRNTLVTVTEVKLNEKLDLAKVFLSVYPEEKIIPVFSKIQDDRRSIQTYINKKLACRFAPRIELNLEM